MNCGFRATVFLLSFVNNILEAYLLKNLSLSIRVEIAIAIALGVVLSYWKIFALPQGGSVTLQMVPIVVVAIRHGKTAGLIGGLLFGVIRMILSPSIYHPVQALLDYPIAFTFVGLAGIWVKYAETYQQHIKNALALTFVFLLRYVSHVFAGKIFFAEYTPLGMNEWWYAITYNAAHLFPELFITLIIVMLLMTRRDLFVTKDGTTGMG